MTGDLVRILDVADQMIRMDGCRAGCRRTCQKAGGCRHGRDGDADESNIHDLTLPDGPAAGLPV
jgi:hypothetical protein